MYRFAEADRLLGVNRGTVQRWVDGYRRQGTDYPPVVRETSTGSPWVTWGEFVEARLLAEFRTRIPMIKLRPLVDRLRGELGQPYPLSFARPYLQAEGRELLLAAQAATQLDRELWIVVSTGQTAIMTATANRFIQATQFSDDPDGTPISITADLGTPDVRLIPTERQGQPTLHGVPTSRLAELVAGGEPLGFVASTYGFAVNEVAQAVSYEAIKPRAS